jgi:hypothetical protein
MKIHSRIVQGEDGHMYFASMDEQGERTDGTCLPTWGSHLWRLRLPERRWEHLQAIREALVAVAGCGRYIFALGYFNHVLHRYDVRTRQFRSVVVGSVGGHVSRNLFCDIDGHVFVPRLREQGSAISTTLVEFDADLREVGENGLANYTQTRDDDSHGIVAFQPLMDGSIVFTTDQGYLYRVVPRVARPALLQDLGWINPRGKSYAACLFTADGERTLIGLSSREVAGRRRYEWLVYDLMTQICLPFPADLSSVDGGTQPNLSLYGSVTRDDEGRCYIGGTFTRAGRSCPLLLQVRSA